jgi:TetR/AcrR family transcriptional regulator of autoinduction and epiphytic fitness
MTVDEVAADVGIAKASLYKHFASKEALAAAAMVRVLERGAHCWPNRPRCRTRGRSTACARWRAGRWISSCRRDADAAVAELDAARRTAGQQGLRRPADASSDQLGEWIVQAQADGDIDPTLPPEVVLYTIFARACDPVPGFLKAGGQYSDEQIVELGAAHLLRRLARPLSQNARRGRCRRRGPSPREGREPQRTSSTGVLHAASTLVATEPMTRLVSVPWPCEPIISRSNLPLSAVAAMVSAAGPTLDTKSP